MTKTIRCLILVLAGLACAPVVGHAQGVGMMGVPWSAGADGDLLDEADVAHLSTSQAQDLERIGEQANRLCNDMRVRALMGGDPHENVLRSSDLIMSHLRASTYNRLELEELDVGRRAGLFDGFGNQALALQDEEMRDGPEDFVPRRDEPLPYDCR